MNSRLERMVNNLTNLREISRDNYKRVPEEWDACQSVSVVALQMEHEIAEMLEKDRCDEPRLRDLLYALETCGHRAPDEVKGIIRELGGILSSVPVSS